MRLFSLDYYRQIMNSDEVNFVLAKRKTQFRVKDQLGPFICNSRKARKEGSERAKAMEKDLTLERPLRQANELLWANIIDFIKDISHLFELF